MKTKTSLMLITSSSIIFAGENFIELGAGYTTAKDNLVYIKEKKSIDLINSPTQQDMVIPVFILQYNGFL